MSSKSTVVSQAMRVVRTGREGWQTSQVHAFIVVTPDDVIDIIRTFHMDDASQLEHAGEPVPVSARDMAAVLRPVRSRRKSPRARAAAAATEGGSAAASTAASKPKKNCMLVLHMFQPALPYTSMRTIARSLTTGRRKELCIHLTYLPTEYHVPFLHVLARHSFQFHKYRSARRGPHDDLLKAIWIFDKHRRQTDYLHDVTCALACADVARDLQNEPSNHMTPERFCKVSKRLLHECDRNLRISILDAADLHKEGMGLVLAVGSSSSYPPRFMVIEHRQDPRYPTVCLVGKGVTFDAGGLRLKPAQAMLDMKQDKSGASVVIAILCHLRKHHPDLPLNVIGLLPMVENVINGRAMKPGDIVKSHSGANVEIMDPDAEGRLILADAISYSSRFKPDYIVNFATLTAFASTVCCDLSAVYYTSDDTLSQAVYTLGEATGERVWRHPPWDEYRVNTVSPVADYRNAIFECTKSGSFMAAMFVANFIPKDLQDRWIHFDISNNDVRGIHTGNCALLGMQLVKLLSKIGTKIGSKRKSTA